MTRAREIKNPIVKPDKKRPKIITRTEITAKTTPIKRDTPRRPGKERPV